MVKTGLNRPLMQKILKKFDGFERKMSCLIIDSATYVSETKSAIKMTSQERKDEVVYWSRTRKRTMRPKLVTEKINDMKIKFGSKAMYRKFRKKKMGLEPSGKTANSAKENEWRLLLTWNKAMTDCKAIER